MKEVQLSNGDKVVFRGKLKGKDYRALKRITGSYVVSDQGEKFKVKDNLGEAYDNMEFDQMALIIEKVITKETGKEIKFTAEYYDELDYSDAVILDETAQEILTKYEKKLASK